MHLFVHIGPHKTGTTSIQKTIFSNRALLSQCGISPFNVGPHQARDLSLRFSHLREKRNPVMLERFGSEEAAFKHSRDCWRQLKSSISESGTEYGLISSEHFSTLEKPIAFYRRLKSMADRITVIAYVRDPVDLFVSSLQEQIKGKGAAKLNQSVDDFRLRFRHFLNYAVREVGSENVIVRNFDRRNLHEGDVVMDFFQVLRQFVPVERVIVEKANISVPGAALAWAIREEMRSANGMNYKERYRLFKSILLSDKVSSLPKLKLENPLWEATIRANNRETCEWVNSRFLMGQLPLKIEPEQLLAIDSSPQRVFSDLSSWVMSYLTADAESVIVDALKR